MQHNLTRNETVQKIIKSLRLTRPLSVSSILIGEPHTGKRTLVRTLFPDLPFVDGHDQEAVEELLDQSDALVIEHYEKLPNADRLNIEGKQIIAIADYAGNAEVLDAMFAFIYTLPPLRERPEDVDLYAQYYQDEACQTLQITFASPPKITQLDLSHNHRSLRASIYREILLADSNRADLERSLYHYFIATLPDQADYHHHLGLLEKPLLEAGLKIYGSQLRLAEALGINRNTLRKKIHEHL